MRERERELKTSQTSNRRLCALARLLIQGWAKEWTRGCVNPASSLPLAASSRNLGTTISPSPVRLLLDAVARFVGLRPKLHESFDGAAAAGPFVCPICAFPAPLRSAPHPQRSKDRSSREDSYSASRLLVVWATILSCNNS